MLDHTHRILFNNNYFIIVMVNHCDEYKYLLLFGVSFGSPRNRFLHKTLNSAAATVSFLLAIHGVGINYSTCIFALD